MAIVSQNGLSADEAEAYLARVWRLLEEFEIATPRVRIHESSDGSLDVALAFDPPEATALLARAKLAMPLIARPHATRMSKPPRAGGGAPSLELDG